jgi:hypothetical protein
MELSKTFRASNDVAWLKLQAFGILDLLLCLATFEVPTRRTVTTFVSNPARLRSRNRAGLLHKLTLNHSAPSRYCLNPRALQNS